MKKTKGKITISRTASNTCDDYISITITDDKSSKRVLEAKLDLRSFANCITGFAAQHCDLTVYDVFDKVGKTIETDFIEFPMPEDFQHDKEVAKVQAEKHCPEGWVPDKSFNSQNSFFQIDGKSYARTTIRRWV